MASDLPTSFDVVVVGTGMSESILAAAFSRIGQQVLHVDKNDFYSGQWASFNLEGIEKWSKRALGEDQLKPHDSDTSALLKEGEQLIDMPMVDDSYSNIKITFHAEDEPVQEKTRDSSVHDINPSEPDKCSKENNESETVVTKTVEQEITDQNKDTGTQVKRDTDIDTTGSDTKVKNNPVAETSDEERNKSSSEIGSTNNQETKSEQENSSPECKSEQENSSLQCESQVECDTESEKTIQNDKDLLTEGENQSKQSGDCNSDKQSVNSQDNIKKEWTKSALKKEWRKFNLDLAPRLLYCRGSMVELLITSDIAKYCEFKTVTRMLTLLNGKLEKVPCSRADVFSSKDVSMLEKRMLMKFLTFCNDYQNQPQEWTAFKDKPFIEYLIHKKLTKNIKHFIQHSIAMVTDTVSTEEGLSKTQKFLHSLGRYGNTAFLWSLYGSGEMPQSFCRMCAVFGGVYCLRMTASSVIVDKENKCCGVITTEGQRIDCRSLSRAILITDKSLLKSTENQDLSLLRLPDPNGGQPITVLELPPSSMACPPGLYPDKPNILWSLYYSHAVCEEIEYSEERPDNVIIMSGPGSEIDMDRPVNEARRIFEKLMPNEDFLPRPPNPEDIIYVDETEATVGGESSQSEFAESSDKSNQSEIVEQTKNEKLNDQSEKQDCDQLCDKTQLENQDLKSDQSEFVKEDSIEKETNKTPEQV
ncbi:hypothetical protein KUTeg_024847 [Tegillarca granosa]|uniref:RAE1/2 domain-containing protein n=1 Tax=Tegillarca granosa TaxID=220873 RepID=A0ABQ9E3L4_TEGGR|nr:hypothetical protein KUTeg_024847 [Tegillarca granosa]